MYNLDELRRIIQAIADPLPVTRVVLVGSYAKNSATDDSDIDLVIDGNDLSEVYWDFLFQLEDTLNISVDLITARSLESSCLKDDFLKGGIVLYEA